jgi:hypothetical protein
MFTIRHVGGVALFLFGTTFLWLTPSFATEGVTTTGFAWSITQVLALVTIAGFTAASWGLFKKAGWMGVCRGRFRRGWIRRADPVLDRG